MEYWVGMAAGARNRHHFAVVLLHRLLALAEHLEGQLLGLSHAPERLGHGLHHRSDGHAHLPERALHHPADLHHDMVEISVFSCHNLTT
jgi:hypothetical protein